MKTTFLLLIVLLCTSPSFSQGTTSPVLNKCKGPAVWIDDPLAKTEYAGGFAELEKYVNENLANTNKGKDTLYRFSLTVTVDCNGILKKAELWSNSEEEHKLINKKIKQLVMAAGKWKPGEVKGVPVSSTRKIICAIQNGKFVIKHTL